MMSQISSNFKNHVALCRDDSIALCKATPREIEKMKQEVTYSNQTAANHNRSKQENSQLPRRDLSGTYKPFMKPYNKLLLVHQQNNHIPALLKNIPKHTTPEQDIFDKAIAPPQKAFQESGYDYRLTYNPKPTHGKETSCTWYNPQWNSNVKTNLGKKLLNIVDKCFPKNHPLNKIFNRHTQAQLLRPYQFPCSL